MAKTNHKICVCILFPGQQEDDNTLCGSPNTHCRVAIVSISYRTNTTPIDIPTNIWRDKRPGIPTLWGK